MILPEYLSTFFLAETPSEGWPRNFHIITAYNPGIILGAELNAKADEELRKEQNLAGSRCFRITGCSPDLKHREEGCGVAGLTDEEALNIGRKYGQNAIFSVTDGILSVIGCLSGEKIKVDSWEKRILSDEESKNLEKVESSDQGIDFEKLWGIVTSQFPLDVHSDHGPDHWKRVEQNGLLVAKSSGADITVVRLFALFHDSRRENEFSDPDHGRRGAAYARELRGTYFQITDEQFELLEFACTWHTENTHNANPTIGTCWDADRLDLGRVGIIPDAKYMNTDLGRQLAQKLSRE